MKKILFLIGTFLIICIICFSIYMNGKEESYIEQIFGIKKSEYEVVSVENDLSYYKYGGSYFVILKVKEEQMDIFLSEVEESFGLIPPEEESLYVFVKNTTGVELSDNHVAYERLSSVKRSVKWLFALKPKTCISIVVYSKPVDGVYEVRMAYVE